MRHGRAKAARKTLQYFKRLTGLSPPYRILFDATIIATLFQQQVLPVKERIDKVLQTFGSQNNVNTYCVTKSAVEELEMIHKSLLEQNKTSKAEAFQQAIQWIKKECKIIEINNNNDQSEHPNEEEQEDKNNNKTDDEEEGDGEKRQNKKKKKRKNPQNGRGKTSSWTKAQKDMILCIEQQQQQQQGQQGQDQRPFVIGSQDETMLEEIRVQGLNPIIRLANQSVLLLEQPSKASQSQTKRDETRKWKNTCLKSSEKQLVDIVFENNKRIAKSEAVAASLEGRQLPKQQRPKSKAKGPNPLSCKKRKSNIDSAAAAIKNESSSSKRRKRAKAAKAAKQQQQSSES